MSFSSDLTLQALASAALAIFGSVTLLWIISLWKRDASIIDIFRSEKRRPESQTP